MEEGRMKGKQIQSSYPLCVWYVYDAIIWEKEKVFKDVKVLGQAVTTLWPDSTAYTMQVTPIPAYSKPQMGPCTFKGTGPGENSESFRW